MKKRDVPWRAPPQADIRLQQMARERRGDTYPEKAIKVDIISGVEIIDGTLVDFKRV
jgi:hypothetical protein